mmetsp:Transcript_5948/g.8156  ORF Transcript_5948/g.8156 Transcript_5948/m.8156 type:complete len:473 (+) Transcript_5948:366-1784(+)
MLFNGMCPKPEYTDLLSNRQLRSACDACVKSKKKCDRGRPYCNQCISKQKSKRKPSPCYYSLKKKPGRKSNKAIQTEAKVNPAVAERRYHVSEEYIGTYFKLFEGFIFILDRKDMLDGLELIHNGTWEKFSKSPREQNDIVLQAKVTAVWCMLSIGALVKGKQEDACYFGQNGAISMVQTREIYERVYIAKTIEDSSVLLVVVSAASLCSMMLSFTGHFTESIETITWTEMLGSNHHNNISTILKCLKVFMPSFSLEETADFVKNNSHPFYFGDTELNHLKIDTQIFFQWMVGLLQLTNYFDLNSSSHYLASHVDNAYLSFNLARQELLEDDGASPLSFARIEISIALLEIFHINVVEEGLQRLKTVINFLAEGNWHILTLDKVLIFACDLMAFAMQVKNESRYYEKIQRLWNFSAIYIGERPLENFDVMTWKEFSNCPMRNRAREKLQAILLSFDSYGVAFANQTPLPICS